MKFISTLLIVTTFKSLNYFLFMPVFSDCINLSSVLYRSGALRLSEVYKRINLGDVNGEIIVTKFSRGPSLCLASLIPLRHHPRPAKCNQSMLTIPQVPNFFGITLILTLGIFFQAKKILSKLFLYSPKSYT